jgi:hypothetical protein
MATSAPSPSRSVMLRRIVTRRPSGFSARSSTCSATSSDRRNTPAKPSAAVSLLTVPHRPYGLRGDLAGRGEAVVTYAAVAGHATPPHAPAMFVVTEADAAAILAALEQRGEFAAAIELRRRIPGITDNRQARECVRTIASWKPLPRRQSALDRWPRTMRRSSGTTEPE